MTALTDAQIVATIAAEATRVDAAEPGGNCTAEEWDDQGLRLRNLGAYVLGLLDADGRL